MQINVNHTDQEKLTEFIRSHWTDLCARLGGRVGEFIEAARSNAMAHELRQGGAVERFVNVCCVLGPNFEQKPENEWAVAILSNADLGEWVKLHQLVHRGASELKRRSADGRKLGDQLLRVDAALLDRLDEKARAGSSDAVALARLSCDIEALDLRLLETDWRREYRHVDGSWQFLPLSDPPRSLRIGPGQKAPKLLCVLACPPTSTQTARLQIRLLNHSVCDKDRHPLLTFAGAHGLWSWSGHSACSMSWVVHCSFSQPALNGLGITLIKETASEPNLLRISHCGLRDDGVPTGAVEIYVCAYAADQWIWKLQRKPGLHWQRSRSTEPSSKEMPSRTSCSFACNGAEKPSKAWLHGFGEALDTAVLQAFNTLFSSWQKSASDAAMTVTADLLSGTAELTWGWREGLAGLGGEPLMRVLGQFDLLNALDLSLTGEVVLGAVRTRVRLVVAGAAEMKHQLCRESLVPALQDVLLTSIARWRFAYRVEFDPIAVAEGAMWTEVGPCTGAIVGETGLRPRTMGGGGWQWYARMVSEAARVPICIHDPLLGQIRQTIELLPDLQLLDWSLG